MKQIQSSREFTQGVKVDFKSRLNKITTSVHEKFILPGLESHFVKNVHQYFEMVKAKFYLQNPSIRLVCHNSTIDIAIFNDNVMVKAMTFNEFCSILGVMPLLVEQIPQKINQYLRSEAKKLGSLPELLSLILVPANEDVSMRLDLDRNFVREVTVKELVKLL